jgi:hypothetical protein
VRKLKTMPRTSPNAIHTQVIMLYS